MAQVAGAVNAVALAAGWADGQATGPAAARAGARDRLAQVWTEIGESVARAGVRKLVLFNSHGGQVSAMDIVARDLRTRCDLIVYSVNWYDLTFTVRGTF